MSTFELRKDRVKPTRRNFISNIQICQQVFLVPHAYNNFSLCPVDLLCVQRRPVNLLLLQSLPLSLFTPSDSADDIPVCAICLDAFKDGDELRNLNCSHCFHRACVDIWLLGTLSQDIQLHGTCPTCRQHAASSPKKTKRLSIDTGFVDSGLSAHMSDISVRSSSLSTSSSSASHSQQSFDLLSPLTPVWSRDEIFQPREDNYGEIGEGLVEEDKIATPLSIAAESAEDSAFVEVFAPNITSDLENIHEDGALSSDNLSISIISIPPSVARIDVEEVDGVSYVNSVLDEVDVLSIFSDSMFSDCGFPLTEANRSRRDE